MAQEWHRVGHRGAPRLFPANTMKGFAAAHTLGCTMVECDIRKSKDGSLVLAHDPAVKDVEGREFVVAEHTAAELADLDLGAAEGVPLLHELTAWALESGCAVMADMKCSGNGVERAVAEALACLPVHQKLVPGADFESRLAFRSYDPTLPLSLSLDAGAGDRFKLNFAMLKLVDAIDTEAVTWQYPLLDFPTVDMLKARGLQVYAWTVDDMRIAHNLLAYGVDGIISNCAQELCTVEAPQIDEE